ncbi:MAG: hypothetical protein V1766_06955 [Pseudomonadota bacterium]
MKTNIVVCVLVAGVLIVAAGAGAYFLLPVMIREQTAGLRSQLQQTEERLQKVEAYLSSEEKEIKAGQLKSGSDANTIIKALNKQAARTDALEGKITGEMKRIGDETGKQRNRIEEGLKEQTETSKKISADAKALARMTAFDSLLNNVKGQILKARLEVGDKNITVARNELDLIDKQFDKALTLASDHEKVGIGELHEMLRKVKMDLDVNFSSAVNRLDLLWHELGKLQEKK